MHCRKSAGHNSWRALASTLAALPILIGCGGASPTASSAIGLTAPTTSSADHASAGEPSTAAPNARPWHLLYQRKAPLAGPVVDIRAVGDVMLGRGVAMAADAYGPDHPFAEVRELLAGQLTLGNLESPMSDRAGPLRPGPYRLPAPPRFADALARAGFSALSLANNHALDLGPVGLVESASALRAVGLRVVGVGANEGSAGSAVFVEVGGSGITEADSLRIALLAFNDIRDPEDEATEGEGWGRAWLNEHALDAVRQARAAADLLIVMPHWGQEYATVPNARQRAWAQGLVDAGADMVLGAHPHVLQPTEILRAEGSSEHSAFVAYSLGNFVFDQGFSEETSRGVVLRLLVDGSGVARVEAAPIQTVNGRARPVGLEAGVAREVIRRLLAVP
jgi:poly-gamma-glutamate synthesis protein (capsule biosynthesis protein)